MPGRVVNSSVYVGEFGRYPGTGLYRGIQAWSGWRHRHVRRLTDGREAPLEVTVSSLGFIQVVVQQPVNRCCLRHRGQRSSIDAHEFVETVAPGRALG